MHYQRHRGGVETFFSPFAAATPCAPWPFPKIRTPRWAKIRTDTVARAVTSTTWCRDKRDQSHKLTLDPTRPTPHLFATVWTHNLYTATNATSCKLTLNPTDPHTSLKLSSRVIFGGLSGFESTYCVYAAQFCLTNVCAKNQPQTLSAPRTHE